MYAHASIRARSEARNVVTARELYAKINKSNNKTKWRIFDDRDSHVNDTRRIRWHAVFTLAIPWRSKSVAPFIRR